MLNINQYAYCRASHDDLHRIYVFVAAPTNDQTEKQQQQMWMVLLHLWYRCNRDSNLFSAIVVRIPDEPMIFHLNVWVVVFKISFF